MKHSTQSFNSGMTPNFLAFLGFTCPLHPLCVQQIVGFSYPFNYLFLSISLFCKSPLFHSKDFLIVHLHTRYRTPNYLWVSIKDHQQGFWLTLGAPCAHYSRVLWRPPCDPCTSCNETRTSQPSDSRAREASLLWARMCLTLCKYCSHDANCLLCSALCGRGCANECAENHWGF